MAARKPMREPGVAELAIRSLIRASLLVRRVTESFFVPYGITPAQWGAMHSLYRAAQEGQPALRLTDLGNRMLVRPPSITGLVDRLERLGMVSRTASTRDLRAKQLSLTPAGRRLVEKILQGLPNQVRTLLGELTPPEQAQLHGLLDRLGSHMESLIDGQDGAAARPAKARTSKE
jgi:DNA-binding MarR family transcriptional regulator